MRWIFPTLLLLTGCFGESDPYEFSQVAPGAREYWVEHAEGDTGFVCHATGRWPIDPPDAEPTERYYGESCSLSLVTPPGLGISYLVFDACRGAYTMRRVVFEIGPDGALARVADVVTVIEINSERTLCGTFEDGDGDAVEEIVEARRRWITDDQGELIDNWAVHDVFHVRIGSRFVPRFCRLWACGEYGPTFWIENCPH